VGALAEIWGRREARERTSSKLFEMPLPIENRNCVGVENRHCVCGPETGEFEEQRLTHRLLIHCSKSTSSAQMSRVVVS